MEHIIENVRQIPVQFTHRGDIFERVFENETHYIYKRIHAKTDYYEVFKRKVVDCMDFETKELTGERKETYPKDEHFGVWAWCCGSYERAITYIQNTRP